MTGLARSALLVALGALIACGPGTPAPEDIGPDVAAEVDVAPEVSEPLFVIGTNPTGLEDPTQFTPLVEGGELEIEFGFQGLWMVVLAFKTHRGLEGLVTLFAKVSTADETLGEFGIAKQVLTHADDGFDYYLNLFLVLKDTGPDHAGKEAWVEVSAEDGDGERVEGSIRVMLTSIDIPDVGDPPLLFPDAPLGPGDEDLGPDLDVGEDAMTASAGEVQG